ncbi:MAG: ABC transporter permease [Desulfovibrio sp.]|nr:ABC transporter permease [Desulfovibrio sp.]
MESSPQVTAGAVGGVWRVSVGGCWNLDTPWPATADTALAGLADQRVTGLILTTSGLDSWDSSLLVFLVQLVRRARARKLKVELDLPEGLKRLIEMAFAVPPRAGAERETERGDAFERIGAAALALPPRIADFLSFLGDVSIAVWNLIIGRSRMRSRDFISAMYECGVQSLPIISLTSMLFGLILAFVGAVQLTQFGAQIYVAGLVGIGMLRVMGAVMVGVVMSGRIGAAYAALIGTMQVNEEVDALETLGISPVDFLVLPRVLALTLMVPLLTIYADLMGIIGGYLVGTLMLNLNPMEYLHATVQMVPYRQILIGLVYGTLFGVVIAIAGCYQGMRCGRSAMAVGQTTTRAVVNSIVGIIVMTAIITIICNVLGV